MDSLIHRRLPGDCPLDGMCVVCFVWLHVLITATTGAAGGIELVALWLTIVVTVAAVVGRFFLLLLSSMVDQAGE